MSTATEKQSDATAEKQPDTTAEKQPDTTAEKPTAEQPATEKQPAAEQRTAVATEAARAVLEPGLDRPVRLVGARLQAAAGALLIAVAAGGGWAVFGTLPDTLTLPAVLAHGRAPETVRTDQQGALLAYRVGPGTAVEPGQVLARLRTADGSETDVRASVAGTVTALLAEPGTPLAPGAAVAALDAARRPATLRLYAASPQDAARLRPGRTVEVRLPGPVTVRATVTAVDPLPARADSLDGTLPVPVPGLPQGAAPVWTAYAELSPGAPPLTGPLPVEAEVDLGARHPYQAVFGNGGGR